LFLLHLQIQEYLQHISGHGQPRVAIFGLVVNAENDIPVQYSEINLHNTCHVTHVLTQSLIYKKFIMNEVSS